MSRKCITVRFVQVDSLEHGAYLIPPVASNAFDKDVRSDAGKVYFRAVEVKSNGLILDTEFGVLLCTSYGPHPNGD